ncbi:hypothetical protein Syun_026654 [Stephania yunnanensis]|uniref:Cytochrome P450 n=1 Tax=Stephania yunnanensis TaxID=152371 RepID=A0AAP0F2V8_9MAGN
MEIGKLEVVGTVGLILLCVFMKYLLDLIWLKPLGMRKKLEKQGISGPSPLFLMGNASEMKEIIRECGLSKAAQAIKPDEISGHGYAPILFPYWEKWAQQYGPLYMYSTGNKVHLYMNSPKLVKEMSLCMSWNLGKALYLAKSVRPLLGDGVIRSNGKSWADQRKIIAPEFYMDKVKGMIGLMMESVVPLLKKWEESIENGGGIAEIKVDQDLRNLSADVISRACFGSCYLRGKEIFSKLKDLKNIISSSGFLFNLSNFGILPTKRNRSIWKLQKEIDSLIMKVMDQSNEGLASGGRSESDDHLLQALMKGAKRECPGLTLSSDFLIDNCKNIYFAGHDTTAITSTWCLMLLALNPEWQDRLRAEIFEICGDSLPDADALNKMKLTKMVIQETLRLYPPSPLISREVLEDTKLGDLEIPKGVYLWTSVSGLHQNQDIWGPDAAKFKPERFANGISEACKLPQGYIPFGMGARVCLGQNFAMFELKLILSLIVSSFSFSLSPNYKHLPAYRMTVEPAYGVDLLVKKVK